MLVFTGYKLCRPKVWYHVFQIGTEQLLIFALTAFVTVTTDLLVGIIVGILAELVLTAWFVASIEEKLEFPSSSDFGRTSAVRPVQ